MAVPFVLYPGDRAVEVIAAFDSLMAEAPDEISRCPSSAASRMPDMFPSEAHGQP